MNPAALALGGLTNGVILLEMAQGQCGIPNGGVRQSSIAYTKVTDRNGKVLLTSKSESSKVLDEGVLCHDRHAEIRCQPGNRSRPESAAYRPVVKQVRPPASSIFV